MNRFRPTRSIRLIAARVAIFGATGLVAMAEIDRPECIAPANPGVAEQAAHIGAGTMRVLAVLSPERLGPP